MTTKSLSTKTVNLKSKKTKSKDLWSIRDGKIVKAEVNWPNKIEKVEFIRSGVSYSSIENISQQLDCPIKSLLTILQIPQTTYNKKKSENAILDSKNSELLLFLSELLEYGHQVFNNEIDKFNRWIQKPNISLQGKTPLSLCDTVTGLEEIRNCLNRIEYGIFA